MDNRLNRLAYVRGCVLGPFGIEYVPVDERAQNIRPCDAFFLIPGF